MNDQRSFTIDWGLHPLLKLVSDFEFNTVLDIGSGEGEHKRFMEYMNKSVYSVDILKQADYVGDFIDVELDQEFDAVWCSHVLEHQRNIGLFLDKIFTVLKPGGVLCVVVPIHPRERLISGHLSSWSIPLLCYNLIMAGFDCSQACILQTYELAIIVKKRLAKHPELRKPSAHGADAGHEFGHIEQFFPFPVKQAANYECQGVAQVGWGDIVNYHFDKNLANKLDVNLVSKNLVQSPVLKPNLLIKE